MAATVIYPAAQMRPDGITITLNPDGTIRGTPVATISTAGKVKPDGSTITIDPDGTIHGSSDVPVATASTAGKVRPDGGTIAVSDGVISVAGPRWEVRRDSGGRLRLAIVIPEVSYG